MNAETIINALKSLKEKYPYKIITRDFFVSETEVSNRQIRNFFGSFTKLSKIASADVKTDFTYEQGETYTESLEYDKKSNTIKYTSKRIKTIEELLSQAEVDEDRFFVERALVNSWESNSNQKGIETLFQVKVFLGVKKCNIEDIKEAHRELRLELGEYNPYIAHTNSTGDNLLILAPVDHHFGKNAKGYTLEKAGQLYEDSINYLLDRVNVENNNIERILLIVGHDLFNTDTYGITTTAGTQQQQAHSWKHVFKFANKVVYNQILKLRDLGFKVDVLVASGNHDEVSSYALGNNLEMLFENDDSVVVYNDEEPRKYYLYGKNLISTTHGKDTKMEKLPLIMAAEEPEGWAKSKYRHIFLGHYHHQVVKEFTGVVAEILPSLCPEDEWHKNHGFVGNQRSSKAFLFNKEKGLQSTYFFNI